MRGLEEAKKLYLEQGAAMIHEKFPEYEGKIAVGLAGHGSECFGFDDELSRDHDFETGFCLWLDDETDVRIGIALSRAYREIAVSTSQHSAGSEKSTGVRRTSDFYRRYTGTSGAPESWQQWMYLPSHALAEATNGQIWRDDGGEFTSIRETILHGMPEDVRMKKIAARAITMAQSGQYNYQRCIKHGENGAAMLAMSEFVTNACDMVYLLNRAHKPYYKWAFRGMGVLEKLSELREAMEFLLTGENDPDTQTVKIDVVEDICAQVIKEMQVQHLTCGNWDYLEPHALDLMGHIQNPEIRAMHIMEG